MKNLLFTTAVAIALAGYEISAKEHYIVKPAKKEMVTHKRPEVKSFNPDCKTCAVD